MMFGRVGFRAFSLVEVTLALGVAAIALLAIFGLLAIGTQSSRVAIEQSASSNLLTAVAADLRATPRTSAVSGQFTIAIPSNPIETPIAGTLYFSSSGQPSTSLKDESRYRCTVTFLPNEGERVATLTTLRMTWPAAADPTTVNAGSAEAFVALDRN